MAINSGKKWSKEDVWDFWNTPKNEYPELAIKLGRELTALNTAHVTKQVLLGQKRNSVFIKPKTSYDKYMFEFFEKGKKPKI